MIYAEIVHKKLASQDLLARRASAASIAFKAIALALLLAAANGCNRNSRGLVPVSGKLIYKGGDWPKPGEVIFSPISAPNGARLTPGMAKIDADGSFKAQTIDTDGLMPGEYGIAIRCMAQPPTERSGGVSALPARYATPGTSGMKLSVPEGSEPIVKEYTIDDK